jgi:hypothetical protein
MHRLQTTSAFLTDRDDVAVDHDIEEAGASHISNSDH